MPPETPSNIDIFNLMSDAPKKSKKTKREELLESTGVKQYFNEGKININKRTCQGLECKLCIKACPTNALYWKAGEIGITEDLCIYCGACVLCCMIDDCIKIQRKRENGTLEKFSTPKGVLKLENNINTKKRFERIKEVFPTAEEYCKRYKRSK